MSFFSDIGSFFSDNGDLIGAGIGLVGNVIGANASSNAAKDSSRVAQETSDDNIKFQAEQAEIARKIFQEELELGLTELSAGSQAALEEIGISSEAAAQQFQQIASLSSGGLSRMQQIAGSNPAILLPEQQIALQDVQRESQNQLDRSALRGSGRAQAAVLSDVMGRTRANFAEQNRNRADSAANFLANQNLNSRRDIANVGTAAAADRARLLESAGVRAANLRTGNAASAADVESNLARSTTTARNAAAASQQNAINQQGANRAGLATSSARLIGEAIGRSDDPLGRVVADAAKGRPSRFGIVDGFS